MLWLEIPALIGVFTLILLNLRNVYTSWQKEPGQITALLLVLVLLLGIMGWREPKLLLIVPLPPIFLAVIWMFGRRLGVEGLTALSVFLGVVLILETVGLVTNPYFFGIEWLRAAYRIIGFIFIILVAIVTPLLIHRSAQAGSAGDRRLSSVYTILALLLIMGLAGTMYRDGLMVEATGHGAEDHMPLAEVELGVIGGILLTFGLRKNHRVLGMAYTVLVPAIIALAYIAGGMINTEAVTASRAERIDEGIAHYYEDNKVFPAVLGELTPGYLPIILGPLRGAGGIGVTRRAPITIAWVMPITSGITAQLSLIPSQKSESTVHLARRRRDSGCVMTNWNKSKRPADSKNGRFFPIVDLSSEPTEV